MQKGLINRFMINNFNLNNIKTYIVNEFQEEEFSMMISNIIDNDHLDFF